MFPGLETAHYAQMLDGMAREVQERLGPRASGEEIVKALNRYMFTEQGFRGNTKNYYDAENSYLNRVLERRLGIPISLAAVYLLVGRRLELPLFGIGMPGHFLVKYESDRYKTFIDCFNGGALLSEKDCARFLVQAGYGFEERYLRKSPPRAMLARMVKNLVTIYSKLDDPLKTDRFTRFLKILEGDREDECDDA